MTYLLDIIVSIFEWSAFFTFPIALLGYPYVKKFPTILVVATIMSVFSFLIRFTSLNPAIIVLIQIISVLLLLVWFFKKKFLESLVITSIGYGFFTFLQMIIVHAIYPIGYQFSEFFTYINLKYFAQILTSIILFVISFILYRFKYQLNELRFQIKSSYINQKYRNILILQSFLTFIFIFTMIYILSIEDFANKYIFSLVLMTILMIILFIYFILYIKFQSKSIIETNKFHLDQEQQIFTFLSNTMQEYECHIKALIKICDKEVPHQIKEYVQKRHPKMKNSPWEELPTNNLSQLKKADGLLYTFIINKQKLANLLGVTLDISTDISSYTPTTILQLRSLNIIINDLIFKLFESTSEEKRITFHIGSTEDELSLHISSSLHIEKQQKFQLKLFDALIQLEKNNAIVMSKLKPFSVSIHCPLT